MGVCLEIPVFSPESAMRVAALGAGRIELNAPGSYPAGGLTPSVEDVALVRHLRVPIRVMVRPHGPPSDGSPDFVYDDEGVFGDMLGSINAFKVSGVLDPERGDGFVFGVLRRRVGSGNGSGVEVDVERNTLLVQAARPYGCTFHRAFDDAISTTPNEIPMSKSMSKSMSKRITSSIESSVPNLFTSSSTAQSPSTSQDVTSPPSSLGEPLEDVILCGFDAVLTSGGRGAAPQHLDVLAELVARAAGRLEVILGGGVRSGNVSDVIRSVAGAGAGTGNRTWVHSSCLTTIGVEHVDEEEVVKMLQRV
jgi:copper homeostasis protein